MTFPWLDLALFSFALLLSSALVWTTTHLCRKQGWVARPRSNRWHRTTPSLYGGAPIWLTCILVSLVCIPMSDPKMRQLLAASTFVFVLGMADDILNLRPLVKLAGQIMAALFVVGSGFVYPLHHNHDVNFVVSVIWIVGISNAFNLLDNMDGLAAGVAVISAIYLAFFYGATGSADYARLAIIAAAAAAGFLVYNFYPARIFMGDCGSLFLGFLLGSLCLPQVTHVSGLPALVLAPCVVLAIPVFDTAFVSVTRSLRRQPISQGGTDHSSHRLVQLGFSERDAVLLLLALSVVSGAIALVARHVLYSHAIELVAAWFLILLFFGIYLQRSYSMTGSGKMAPVIPDSVTDRMRMRDAMLIDATLIDATLIDATLSALSTQPIGNFGDHESVPTLDA